MNGPQHYAEAERLLKLCEKTERGSAAEAAYLAEAHVNATLALVAAQVAHSGNSVPKVWAEVLKP